VFFKIKLKMRKIQPCIGPKNGSLLIAGGGSYGFTKEFMELIGGPKSKIVIGNGCVEE